MTIATTTDIYAALRSFLPILQKLTGEPAAALEEAVALPSPVDTVVNAMEALYAAVKTGDFTADGQPTVVCGCCQAAYLVTFYQWHGKTQRAADITAAMNAIDGGETIASACASIAVDTRFAPPPAPILAPPPAA